MKFVLPKQELSSLINKLQSIVPQKPAVPILSHLYVEATNDEVIVTATDLTVGMRCFTEAKILEEGSATFPAKHFFQLVRELPSVGIEITTHAGDATEIVAGPSRFKIHGMKKEDYPALPGMQEATLVKVDQKSLKEALFQTAFSVSKEDNRYALTGVCMQIIDCHATFVGTDGKRLAKTSIQVGCENTFKSTFVLPYKTVEELQRVLSDEGMLSLRLMSDKISIEAPKFSIFSKLLSGEYPDFARIIPKKTTFSVTLHREELMAALRQVSLFTTENHTSARFSFTQGELLLSANSAEMGEGVVTIPVDYSQAPFQIAFNPNYFLDILRHSRGETVNLGLIDPYNPGVITDSTAALFIIMPLRLYDT